MELIREIIVPTDNTYLLKLPDEMIGKQVEVIAFEIEARPAIDIEERRKRLHESLADLKVDLSNFKFDRDEANNYDE
ncbi:hypothetical protein ACFP1I_31030 [Dyadobacter subterraneus]|uniref:DUF3006 domain-containing protein n=1 Tax=Dyadobacter subterraneus TaxID=2773304 RepID=A0ABR9W8E5_9BACT|nr:hypothetical protein [Dyadobacter subterraneus]MBE9461752.1 hypothetical protein [Dyadobacter subterraneus]